jgi:hypothetical protein
MKCRRAACQVSNASRDCVFVGRRRAFVGRCRYRLRTQRSRACLQVWVAFVDEARFLLSKQLALVLYSTVETAKAC